MSISRAHSTTEQPLDAKLSTLFFALADTFCSHLQAQSDCSTEDVFLDGKAVFFLCVAGGLNPHNSREMNTGANYIYTALGLEIDPVELPELPTVTVREFFSVTEAKAIEVCKRVIGGAV